MCHADTVSTGVLPINRLLTLIPKRAESRQAEQLRDTFVDSGVAAAMETVDHQVLYGRRGTGKTHALRYLETLMQERGDVSVYIDLRTVGSPEGLFLGEAVHPTERAARLLVDALGQLHDSLLEAALNDDRLIVDAAFVDRLDRLLEAITSIRVRGEVEIAQEGEQTAAEKASAGAGLTLSGKPQFTAQASSDSATEHRSLRRETRRGSERVGLNFTDVARALRDLAAALSSKRVWLLLDEWSSLPTSIQPYLAEFLVRCVLPLQAFTVKIAAIEQQSTFRTRLPEGTTIGIELGADVTANLDLDEFMVFEQNEEKARTFFRGLLFKHLTSGVEAQDRLESLATERDLVRIGFTDSRVFDELVRAAEGVPRDALNVLSRAALHAGDRQVSVPDIRRAAQAWYQTDKAGALRSRDEAQQLLNWVIDNVIREKRARGFLVNQKDGQAPLLLALFDARVLHLVRRGYSAQDEPGERYDVYVIDYGAYVDLMRTKNEPRDLLPVSTEDDSGAGYVDVPTQDLRSLRRAILDLEVWAANSGF